MLYNLRNFVPLVKHKLRSHCLYRASPAYGLLTRYLVVHSQDYYLCKLLEIVHVVVVRLLSVPLITRIASYAHFTFTTCVTIVCPYYRQYFNLRLRLRFVWNIRQFYVICRYYETSNFPINRECISGQLNKDRRARPVSKFYYASPTRVNELINARKMKARLIIT